MSNFYFYNKDSEMCNTLEDIKDMISFDGLSQKEVYKAKMVTGSDTFFCTKFYEVAEVGQVCGKQCEGYKPRNGKNGRCVYSSNCYEKANKVLIKLT